MAKGRHRGGARPGRLPPLRVAAIALAMAAARAAAQGEAPPPMASALPAEAPASLFSASLGKEGEADAELYVKGTWAAELIGSLVLQMAEGGPLEASSASPLLFTQDPDLFLSFLLFKKAFVEAKVTKDLGQSRFAAGYRGGEDEALKEARIGNDGISFPSLPFLSFGEGSYRSFGASARVESGDFAGRAMVRYDQAERVVKKFVGGSEVTETAISPNAFITGRYFATSSAPAASPQVFVQSAAGSLAGGDGRLYRKLGPEEFSFSAATGFISLRTAATTRVLAYYAGSGSLSDAVAIAGVGPCDLLYEPPPETSLGTLDPKLQVLCRYAATASAENADAYVVNAASGLRDPLYEARIDPAGFIEVLWDDTILSGVPADAPIYRRPFESEMGWLYITDYSDPKVLAYAPVFSRRIVVRTFSPASAIAIDKDIIAGSVEVRRNGVQDFAFAVDSEAGVLKLATPPSPSEEIEVSYMRESAERRAGMLSAALGGFWKLREGWSAWSALGTSWSVPGSSYTAEGATSPGRIGLTGGEKYSRGALTHSAAAAASYSRDDATGRYRIEGMEGSGSFVSTFRPSAGSAAASGFAIAETKEEALASAFPKLGRELHEDGSTQQALRIASPAAADIPPPAPAAFEKIVAQPPYESFKVFSFLARIPSGATLSLRMDDGAASPTAAMSVASIAGGAYGEAWTRFSVRYGSGDARVYSQAGDDAAGAEVTGASASFAPLVRASRVVIELSGHFDAGQAAWVDEICLEDSVGRVSAMFQGSVAYKDPELRIGTGSSPVISGLEASADVLGGLSDSPFASGGASLKTSIGFVGLSINARATAVEGEPPSLRGGHALALPSVTFPVSLADSFDFDPASGSFGREDSATASAGSAAAASARQKTTWTPPSYLLGEGLFSQEWSGKLSIAESSLAIGLDASNRSMPPASEGPPDSDGYFASWIGSFAYALPAFERHSERRTIAASVKARWPGAAADIASFSAGTVAEPRAADAGYRRDSSTMRIEVPLSFKALSLTPYYARAWKDRRDASGEGLAEDAELALSDLSALPVYYASLPFAELFSTSRAGEFATQSSGIAQALLSSELGFSASRDVGSSWLDLVLPSSIAAAYRRELSRQDDSVADTDVWQATAAWAAINLFGKLGAHPSGLSYDSDEYAGMMKATLASPRGGGPATISIQSQQLATFYAGASDRLDADNRLSIDSGPGSGSWTEELKLSLSRRTKRHFLLDLYRLIVPSGAAPQGEGRKASVASKYLEALSSIEPSARSILSFSGGVDGSRGDAAGTRYGWKASESYEARVIVPEMLTLKAACSLTQARDSATGTLSFGLLLGLGATISF